MIHPISYTIDGKAKSQNIRNGIPTKDEAEKIAQEYFVAKFWDPETRKSVDEIKKVISIL
jgi:hypothetical protein